MEFTKLFLALFATSLFMASCSTDSPQLVKYVPLGTYDQGVLVLNQGLGATSSLSYISSDLATSQNDIYFAVNPALPALGGFGQDVGFNNDQAYVVLDNSNSIQIINRYSMANIGAISTGMNHPRYIAFANNKIYVSNQADFADLSDDFISVYNIQTNALIKTIAVPGGSAEKVVVGGNSLYVAQGGEFGTGNKIVVINTVADTVASSITVGDSPNSLQIDNNGFLWVLCGGNSKYYPSAAIATAGTLVKINLNTNAIVNSFSFTDASLYPNNFTVFGSNGYYMVGQKVYKMALTDAVLTTDAAFTTVAQTPNAFALKANRIYIADAVNFNSNGKVYVYSLGSIPDSQPIGTLQQTFTVGLVPAGFYFNQ